MATARVRSVFGVVGAVPDQGEVDMRRVEQKVLAVGIVVASLGLASCGVKASLDQAVASLGAQPSVQIHLSASAAGAGSTQVQKVMSVLSLDMSYASTNGSALSDSAGNINSDIKVNVGNQSLAEIRQVDSNLYVTLDASALSAVPGVNLSPTEIASIQLIAGGRWFELPKSLLNSYIPSSASAKAKAKAQAAKDVAISRQIIDDLTAVIAATPYKTLAGGGYSQTGTLESIVKAVLPTIKSITSRPINVNSVKGTYEISVTMSGSTATGGSIKITAPSGSGGDASVALETTVTHASSNITAPSGATVITPALLKGLMSQAAG